MASFDFKTATPETAISPSNLLFGATSFAAANPSVFPVSTLNDLLIGGGTLNVLPTKTFTVNNTITLSANADGQTYTLPAVGGTFALLNAANAFTTANTVTPSSDVTALTLRRYIGGASNILQLQDESNNALATFDSNGYLSLGRGSGLTGQLKFYNIANANTVTVKAGATSLSWDLTLPPGPGSADYVLTTNGSGASTWEQVSLTTGVKNTLPVGNGGTGQTTLAIHGVLVGNATSGVSVTATGSAGQFFVSQGASADPTWTTATFPTTAGPVGTILRSDGTNWIATTATYPTTTTAGTVVVSATANTISSTATPTLGVAGTTAGSLSLSGGTSGAVTINVAAAAGTWSLTLPTSGGTSGYLLATDGSGASSWFNLFGTANTFTANQTFAGVAYLADGTAAAPSLAFTNSTTTGLYRYGSNAIGIATNGSYVAQFDASGRFLIGTNTAGNSAANVITLAGTGSSGLTIRSGATSTGSIYFSRSTSGTTEFAGFMSYDHTSDYMSFGTNATEQARISSTGALWQIVNGTTTSQYHKWGDGTVTYAQIAGVYDSATAGHMELYTLNAGVLTEWMRIPSTGGLQINGSTSGSVTVKAPAVAGTTTFQLPSSNGTNGYILSTDGSGATSWTDPTVIGIDINVGTTVIVGGTSGRVLYDNAGVVGEYTTVPLSFGGTNASLTASNGGIVYSDATAFAVLSGTATANQIILSGSNAAPSWSTATYPATTAAGTLLTSATANAVTASATPTLGVAGSVAGTLGFSGLTSGVVTVKGASVAGTWTFTLPTSGGTNGYVLSTDGAGNSGWVDPALLPITLVVGSTATSGGASGQIMFDTGSVLQEDAGLTYSSVNKTITLNSNAILGAPSAATLRLGAASAASPVAQTLTVQSVASGTSDTAGATWTFAGSQGTGTGVGGSIVFQVAPAGASGSTPNSLATALTISSTKASTFGGDIVPVSGTTAMTDGFTYIPAAAGAPSGVPTGQAGRVPLYYDSTNNYLYVYNGAWKRVSFADNFLTQE